MRALTCRKEKSGWKVVGAQGQRQKSAQSRRYGQVHQSQEAGGKQQGTIFL